MSNIKFMRGVSKDKEYYEHMLSRLQKPLEDQIKSMEQVLQVTLSQARNTPMLADNPILRKIITLEDLID